MYTPLFEISPHLLKTITACTDLQNWIKYTNIHLDWQPRLQRETATRLAHFSTSIEGNPLSLNEVEHIADGIEIGTLKKAEMEVQNYLKALRWIWTQPPNSKISESQLLGLHQLITNGLLPDTKSGHYKTTTNKIMDHNGHIVYTAPSPQKSIQFTQELLAWINAKETQVQHPIIINAIAHHRLVSIHPFSDGNGRTARALGMWLFHNLRFDPIHLLPLDEVYATHRLTYYDKIQQARDLDNVLTYWIEYVATGTLATLLKAKKRIQSLQIATKTAIKLSRKQEQLLRYIEEKGRVRSPDIEADFNISRARVSQLLKPLTEVNLVTKEGFTSATVYRLSQK